MRTLAGRVVVLVLAVCVMAPAAGMAGERQHKVRNGESASSIAKRYYGEFELGSILLKYNGKHGTVIRAGETIRVPYCDVHKVKRGDTWSSLAQKYLGRASAYAEVAALNGLPAKQPLQVGNRIVFPALVPHRLERGDTLTVLAERFYGDADFSHVLQGFNGIEDPRQLSVGELLKIPLVSLQLRGTEVKLPTSAREAKTRPRASKTSGSKVPPASPRKAATQASDKRPLFKPELRAAEKAFNNGEYARAREQLESLKDRVGAKGSKTDKAELWRLLTFVYVAYDIPEEACTAYRSLVESSPKVRLDPDLVSPRIRNTLSRCKRQKS